MSNRDDWAPEAAVLAQAVRDGSREAEAVLLERLRPGIELLLRRREGEAPGDGSAPDPDKVNELFLPSGTLR